MQASLPMAMAIALSPFAIIPAIVLLLTPRPRAAGGAFLLGWLLGVGIASGITVATALPASDATGPSAWVAWARLALGATLLVLGIVRWRGRSRAGASPAWLQGIQDATPRRALGLGLMLSLANPKVLLLAIAGGLAIGAAGDGWLHGLSRVLAFTLLASTSVAAPAGSRVTTSSVSSGLSSAFSAAWSTTGATATGAGGGAGAAAGASAGASAGLVACCPQPTRASAAAAARVRLSRWEVIACSL